MRKQLPLIAISALIAVAMLAAGISQLWVWLVWAVVVASQIGVGLGWPEKLAPKPPAPARHQRPDYADRLAQFDLDRQHQQRVDDWRARHPDQQ